MYEIYEKLLREKGLRSADVSKATGVAKPVFSYWKSGRSEPNRDNIQRIAKFLGVSVEYITTGQDPNSSFDMKHAFLIEKYEKLNRNGQQRLEEYMELLLNDDKFVQKRDVSAS